jgi:hypothetical protein
MKERGLSLDSVGDAFGSSRRVDDWYALPAESRQVAG